MALTELNVSSLADWPLSYRTLQFRAPADLSWIRIVSPALPTPAGQPSASSLDDLRSAWSTQACQGVSDEVRSGVEAAVIKQNKDRTNYLEALAIGLTTGGLRRQLLYRDFFNNTRTAILALSSLARADSAFSGELERQINPGRFSKECRPSANLSESAADLMHKRLECEANLVPTKLLPTLTDTWRAADRSAGLVAAFHSKIAQHDHNSEPLNEKRTRIMACIHTLAAETDYRVSGIRRSDEARPCQFIAERVARRSLRDGKRNICAN